MKAFISNRSIPTVQKHTVIATALKKKSPNEALRLQQLSGFYSGYFLMPNKGDRLLLILDLGWKNVYLKVLLLKV